MAVQLQSVKLSPMTGVVGLQSVILWMMSLKVSLQVFFTPNLKRFNLDYSKSCQSGDPPAPGPGEWSERSAAGQQLLLQEQDDAAADREDGSQAHITRHQAGGLVWS